MFLPKLRNVRCRYMLGLILVFLRWVKKYSFNNLNEGLLNAYSYKTVAQMKIWLTFCMRRGWAKSLPPWRRNPQGDASCLDRRIVSSWWDIPITTVWLLNARQNGTRYDERPAKGPPDTQLTKALGYFWIFPDPASLRGEYSNVVGDL